MTAGHIESVLHEERVFHPTPVPHTSAIPSMAAYQALVREAEQDFDGFWRRRAEALLHWRQPFQTVLDCRHAPFYQWFPEGRLNVSENCLDVHLHNGNAQKIALIFENDEGEVTQVSYQTLTERVCQLANGLKSLGCKLGDRVVIYMPMSIEAVVAMQACARLGLTHSVVFGGFSAKSLHERIVDVGARLVITADEQHRGGKVIPLKNTVDQALQMPGAENVEAVVVYARGSRDVAWVEGRDQWWHALIDGQSSECEPVPVPAEHPLFVLYTSGSTGRPKGVQHSSAGYLLWAKQTMLWSFDLQPDDVFWCTADVGWITGHTYICYGPLAAGATQVMFEGTPTFPHVGRFWEMIDRHRVSIFYTAPTAIRALIKAAEREPARHPRQYDLSTLRLLGSVGEPINPEAWMWYYQEVGKTRCPVTDTWWQTETGAHILAPMPVATPLKPGSCTLPLPGMAVDVVDETGASLPPGQGGSLVITRPWPGMIRNVWGDPERFKKTYFPEELDGAYLAGDSAQRDQDGYYWILGRMDDVLNVSGHRLGTMELESALVSHEQVAEAAVVGRPDALSGEAVVAFVVLKNELPDAAEAKQIADTLRAWVSTEIGAIARPADIRFGENLPKTRSGKIMRRLLRVVAQGETVTQDVSTLENPAILEQLSRAY